ncbi:MAG: exonuclease SbcCD subunit D [Chloroflexota bacterium]
MLRLLHTADVHLGARHADLGDAATAQRERQFAAFKASVDVAIEEKVDLFVVAGDLFDSNTQPRRSVERVAAELARLANAKIRTMIVPGTHDCYDRASIYRAYDLKAMAGSTPDDDLVTVVTPDRPTVRLATLDATVHAAVFPSKRAPYSPLRDVRVTAAAAGHPESSTTWHVGVVHGALAIPDRTEHDEVVVTKEEIAASGLDYLALGHWHSTQKGKAGTTTYAYAGAPEPVAVDQDGAGKVLLVTLEESAGKHAVKVDERTVGRTRFERIDVDASRLNGQPDLVEKLAAKADPDLVLEARLTGVRPDELDVDIAEVESRLKGSFLRLRVRDQSMPALSDGALPSADTISGAFIRNVEGRIAELEADPSDATTLEAAELRDALRLGRLLLAGHEVSL